MLGLLVGAIAGGVVVWKYRDFIGEYMKGNAGPAREKMDGILGTVQRKSETLLDRAKVQVSMLDSRRRNDLRRSAVRNLIRAGVTEPVAMSISGHRSPSVFRRYNITTVDDQRRALAATQAYVTAKQKPLSQRRQG